MNDEDHKAEQDKNDAEIVYLVEQASDFIFRRPILCLKRPTGGDAGWKSADAVAAAV